MVFPVKFILRHYPIRSQSHGEKKILAERRARFDKDELKAGWHAQYDDTSKTEGYLDQSDRLILYDENLVRLKVLGATFDSIAPAMVWRDDARRWMQEAMRYKSELQGIYDSHAWKLLGTYYRLRDSIKRKMKRLGT
jgi:hypothetical protein